ncbi:hypothetical protein COV19_03320 [Candidatus Woesearchaeota archaeon CG10_big_fil_rev_8_21_14_0_10_44_13]|nr:MAG: hypothetical protein COV19_03320 [Candidatus Woesearchaeota archaeon CG10_big_fil_rev_8_21_14_0_10_44_13]
MPKRVEMIHTDYASKERIHSQKAALKGCNRRFSNRNSRNPHSDGFLSGLNQHKYTIAASVITVLLSAKAAFTGMQYLLKDRPQTYHTDLSRSQPIKAAQTTESNLERIAQDNHIIIQPAQADVNPIPQARPAAGTKQEAKATAAPVKSVDILAGYIKQTYDGWNKKHNKTMGGDTAKTYAGWINKYAAQYKIDPLFLAALISHESRFTNANGDLDSSNYSEGLGQIRKLTQKDIRKLMKKKGEDIRQKGASDPETGIHMAAFYLSYLRDSKDISLWRAFGHYNGGPGFMNEKYANKIMGEYNGIQVYFTSRQNSARSSVVGMR